MNYRRKRVSWRDSRRLHLIVGLVAFALVMLAAISLGIYFKIDLQVNGGSAPLQLVYGKDTYQEPGATAKFHGQDLNVEISGAVDVQNLGTYTVTYRAGYWWIFKSLKRQVQVVDTTAPVITLHKTPGYTTPPGEEYREEGYTAIDDHDGDITSQVQVTVEGETVVYTVTDSSGNQAREVRPIIRQDMTIPEITLHGSATVTIKAGTPYVDQGATATDYVDGDITSKIQVSSTVNIYSAGTYKVTYTVADSGGNVATAERTVIVEAIRQPDIINPDQKVIYLTFDDGPWRHTQQLLDILERYNVKATFFVCDVQYPQRDELLRKMVKGGHSIGVHSFSHEYKEIYASEEAFFKDIYKMQQIIKDATGVTTTLMRFPGGSSNSISKFNPGIMTRLTKAVTDQGFQYFDWNITSGDADSNPKPTKESVVQNVINAVIKRDNAGYKTSVVLQHDLHQFSVEAAEEIIVWGLANGYSFQALTPNSPTCHHKVNN